MRFTYLIFFCVNRSGKSLTVTLTNGGSQVIGTITPNEVYMWLESWNGNVVEGADYQAIYFKAADGTFKNGWVNGITGTRAMTRLTECSLYDIDILGTGVQSVFRTRRAVDKYSTSGNKIGTIPANSFVSTENATCGSTNHKLMHIASWGEDGSDPTLCNMFIDPTEAGMAFSSFALEGELN